MDCLKVHDTYAYMKGHKIVNANEVEKKRVSFDLKGLDRCNQHEKILKFFCEDENKLCCSTCAIVYHRKCISVVEVKNFVGNLASKSSNLKVKLHEVKQKVEILITNVVSSTEKLDEDIKEIPSKIRRMRDEVIKMFDKLEVSVVKDAESFKTEAFEKLTKKQVQNEKYLADIQSCLETIDNVYQNGTSVQQFIVEQKIKKRVNVLQKKVFVDCQNFETVTVTFNFDESLKLPPLPVIDYVPGQLNVKSNLSEAASTVRPDVTTMMLTPVISVGLEQTNDGEREPLYRGIDFLPDGRLVAVDNYNKKCLLYNEKLEKVGSYQLSYPPQSVVAVSEQEVAITRTIAHKLDILHVNESNDISLDRSYKVTAKYDSICLKGGKYFVVGAYDDPTPIRILSFTGEEKDFNINFPNKKYSYGASACTYIRNSDKIVLTDQYEHTVFIYDIKTNTRVVVKDDLIKEPRGVTVGPSDTILVCCQETNSIVQISQTDRILSSYKLDIHYPGSICVSRDKSFLVVTNGQRNFQKLKISY